MKWKKIIYAVLLISAVLFIYDYYYGRFKIQAKDVLLIKATDYKGNTAILEEKLLVKDIIKEFRDKKRVINEGDCDYDNKIVILKNNREIMRVKVARDGCETAIFRGKTYSMFWGSYHSIINKLKEKGVKFST